MVGKNEPPVATEIITFVKNRMVTENAFGATMEESLRRSLSLLSTRGTTRDANLAESSLAKVEEEGNTEVGRTRTSFFSGPTFPLEDCSSQELVVGRLTFQLLDYGGEIRLNQRTREQLGTGEEKERNQCAVLSFSAGYEWIKQGQPSRPHGAKRVSFVAQQHREAELQAALRWLATSPTSTRRYECEMQSIAHEPTNVNHERDLRSLNHFLRGVPYFEKISPYWFWKYCSAIEQR